MKRKLESGPVGCLARHLRLTQADFDAASPFIPDDVPPGSAYEDAWVYGVREARIHPTWESPSDPNCGGGFYANIVKGFQAVRKQHEVGVQRDNLLAVGMEPHHEADRP